MRSACVLDLLCELAAEDRLVIAEHLVQLFAGMGQDRRPEHLEPIDGLQRHVDSRGRLGRILLDQGPGRTLIQILVDTLAQPARLGQCRLELGRVVECAHALEAGADIGQQRFIDLGQLARRRA